MQESARQKKLASGLSKGHVEDVELSTKLIIGAVLSAGTSRNPAAAIIWLSESYFYIHFSALSTASTDYLTNIKHWVTQQSIMKSLHDDNVRIIKDKGWDIRYFAQDDDEDVVISLTSRDPQKFQHVKRFNYNIRQFVDIKIMWVPKYACIQIMYVYEIIMGLANVTECAVYCTDWPPICGCEVHVLNTDVWMHRAPQYIARAVHCCSMSPCVLIAMLNVGNNWTTSIGSETRIIGWGIRFRLQMLCPQEDV